MKLVADLSESWRTRTGLRVRLGLAVLAASCTAVVAFATAAPFEASLKSTALAVLRPAAATDTAAHDRIASAYGKLPISFEPNVGQAPSTVKYLARAGGYSVGLTEQGALLNLAQGKMEQPGNAHLNKKSAAPVAQSLLRLSLVHAKAKPDLRAEARQESFSNYFVGNDRSKWHSQVAHYGAVRYEQVYPGIDWVIYGNPQQLEYDLVVAPNAEAQQIKLKIDGADRLSLDSDGDLLIQLKGRTLRQLKPVIYQDSANGERQHIAGHYVLDQKNRQLGFAMNDYDHSRRLIIDPAFVYSTYLGGKGSDNASAIAIDGASNAYVAGSTTSIDFPTLNPLQGSNAATGGNSNAFVAKLNADGSALLYSTYLGGSGFGGGGQFTGDFGGGIAVDSVGNAYVVGVTYSTDFPTVNPLQSVNAGAQDAFVAKLNANGSALLYSTYLGGSGGDSADAVAVDSAGNAYVAGGTYSTNFPTANPLQSTHAGIANGGSNGFVAKLNAAGSALLYSTYLGGNAEVVPGSPSGDFPNAIAVDGTGNAYLAGYTSSTDFPTVNPLQATLASSYGNAFVAKLNMDGSALLYSTYLGGSGFGDANSGFGTGDGAAAIAVDSAGNAYVAGYTSSTDFPTVHPLQSVKAGIHNAFIAKFNAAGNALLYSTYLGGSNSDGQGDSASAIAVDSTGNAYVAGFANSPDFPTVNPLQGTLASSDGNAFVAKLNAAGDALLYSTYLGGSMPGGASAIAVDGSGDAYVAGSTSSTDFPTAHALQGALAGYENAFVAKINSMPAGATPPAPSGVTAIAGTAQVVLAWPAATSNVTSYNLYQGTKVGGEALAPVKTSITGTSVTVSDLNNGTPYYFKITALNVNGESAQSAEVSATPGVPSTPSTPAQNGEGGGGAAGWDLIAGLGLALAARRRKNPGTERPRQSD